MTSIAQMPSKVQTALPFAAICSFIVPTTELDPDFIPSVSVRIGDFETKEEAKKAFEQVEHHPALISAWCR